MTRLAVTLALCVSWGCGATATPPPSAPAPAAAEPSSEPEPLPHDAPTHRLHECGQNPDDELPVVTGSMGEGERVVRLINNSGAEVQARLLNDKLAPALPGTLRIEPRAVGEFRVPAGIYQVRYRDAKSCKVRRGAPLVLTGPRAGVEISIKPRYRTGSQSKMHPVKEPL